MTKNDDSPTMADPKIVALSGTLRIVKPGEYKFAPENYKLTWKDRLWNLFWRLWPFKPAVM